MLIFQQGFIAKKLKGRSSRILKEEFPHLIDWCGEQIWAPGCFMAAQGMVLWRQSDFCVNFYFSIEKA
ncbi:MAG: hypothetical protein EPN24_06830 [Candidatus Methanoperedens sp.]|nr:MAG: hypothetical protein EPN24_06830 [Candidatus Methanoperedens sp.]